MSFWIVSVPKESSWGWRKILEQRAIARPLLKHIVGQGDSFFFSMIIGTQIDHRIKKLGTIFCIILVALRFWRLLVFSGMVSKELVLIQRKLHQVLIRQDDTIIWICSINGKYGCITSWEVIRAKLPIIIWLKLQSYNKEEVSKLRLYWRHVMHFSHEQVQN